MVCRIKGTDPDTGAPVQTALLALSSSSNDFERNCEDRFVVEARCVGDMAALEIGHDNSGMFADWHLQHVEVHNSRAPPGSGTQYFMHSDWIRGVKGCAHNMVTIPAASAPGADKRYSVRVHTVDTRGAGTDADVSIILFGQDGKKTGEHVLSDSANNFERGAVDEFLLNLKGQDLGALSLVNIGFANAKTVAGKLGGMLGSAWMLSHVEVVHLNTGAAHTFFYNDWIKRDKQSGRVDIAPGGAADGNVYTVSVYTSDIRGAGTDSVIRLTLFGRADDGTVTQLPAKGEPGRLLDSSVNNFERGMVDKFTFKGADLGAIFKLLVSSNDSGLGSDWHLNQITVADAVRASTTTFPYDDWIAKGKGVNPGLQQVRSSSEFSGFSSVHTQSLATDRTLPAAGVGSGYGGCKCQAAGVHGQGHDFR